MGGGAGGQHQCRAGHVRARLVGFHTGVDGAGADVGRPKRGAEHQRRRRRVVVVQKRPSGARFIKRYDGRQNGDTGSEKLVEGKEDRKFIIRCTCNICIFLQGNTPITKTLEIVI